MITLIPAAYTDFLLNMNLGFDRAIRCHSNLDFAISVNGDIIELESTTDAVIQKIFLWLSIKKGEIPGEPTLGCCIYKYFYKKAIPDVMGQLQGEIYYEMVTWIPELNVKSVTVRSESTNGRVDAVGVTIISGDYGTIQLDVNQNEMESMNNYLMSPISDFSQAENSQLQDVIL